MLSHVRTGAGEPLVLLHPLGADRHVWNPVLDLLAAERDLIVPDLPGFGASPRLPEGTRPTAAVLAGAVAELLDDLGIETAHTAGISLGAWVALELALQRRARSVAAIAPAGLWRRPLGPRAGAERGRRVGRLLAPLLSPLLAFEGLRRRALAGVVARPERVPAREAIRLARAYFGAPGYTAANAEMRAAVFEGAARLDVPVTVAWGELDRMVSPSRHAIPGAETLVLERCGHVPTWDDSEQVAGVVLGASSSRLAQSRRPQRA